MKGCADARRLTCTAAMLVGLAVGTSAQISETAKLLAGDGAFGDQFGESVALAGERSLVGAPRDADLGAQSGSAYVFERQGDGAWTQVAKLLAADGASGDQLGHSVALSGDFALLGAPLDADLGSQSGSAYVFERQGDGSWAQVAKLLAADGASGDIFGWSVSLSGQRALVGAPGHGGPLNQPGAAYVFEQQAGGTWVQVAKLQCGDGVTSGVFEDQFGVSVSLSGERALIGALWADDAAPDSGSACVFERQAGGAWVQTARLLAADGETFDGFGGAVSLSAERALVGSPGDSDLGSGSGSAYVFERQGDGSWVQVAKLLAGDGASGDVFGVSVSLSGERGIIGAYGDALGKGSAYFFERLTNGVWVQGAKLLPSGSIGTAEFGGSVSLSGGLALVGAAHAPGNGLGSAYVFKLPPSWTDVGFSLSGMAGEPSLVGSGSLLPGSAGAITLSDAAPSSPALLFLSLATTPTPFKCGTLVPVPPAAQIFVVTGGGGSITLEWTTWPGGLSGANLSLQYAIQDVTAVCGVALSNALTAELP